MSLFSATFILVFVPALALLVAAPMLYFLRRTRKKRGGELSGLSVRPLTFLQALPGLLIVFALFFAYAAAYIAPQSWFGQRVTTMEGRFWLFVLVWLTLFAFERVIRGLLSSDKTKPGSE